MAAVKIILEDYDFQENSREELRSQFIADNSGVVLILYNLNYHEGHDTPHDTPHAEKEVQKLLGYCAIPRSRQEIMDYMHLVDRKHFYRYYLTPLLASGKIAMTIPDKPKSKLQKYVSVNNDRA